ALVQVPSDRPCGPAEDAVWGRLRSPPKAGKPDRTESDQRLSKAVPDGVDSGFSGGEALPNASLPGAEGALSQQSSRTLPQRQTAKLHLAAHGSVLPPERVGGPMDGLCPCRPGGG